MKHIVSKPVGAIGLVLLVSFAVEGAPKPRIPVGSDAEQSMYLRALSQRMAGAPRCYPGDLSEEELERLLEANGARSPVELLLEGDERFFHSSIVWTGDGLQGSSARASRALLTYSFPDDGVLWGAGPIVPNDMNSGLAHAFGGANFDLAREHIRQAFAGWRRTAGLTYTEVADNNTQMDSSNTRVSTRGDARIGGGFVWPDSYLAYNFFPSGGSDVFFNSRYWEGNFLSRPNDSFRYLRNVMSHEHGHGLGFIHVVPCNQVFNMEPFLTVAFDMQQVDDLRNAHRNYGDRFAGNNSAANAMDFGNLTTPSVRSVIERTLSTNGTSGPNNTDEDWFRFTTSSTQNIVITATPTGGSYINGQQSGGCSGTIGTVDAVAAGNLNIELCNADGSVVILSASSNGAGLSETITANARPAGTYTVRVVDVGPNSSSNQTLQLYDLTVRVGSSLAPPTAIAGVNKRVMAGVTCAFIGDLNSRANEAGASITTYDWDLDANGSFETLNNPRPTTVYNTVGTRNVVLRVTDSNGQTDTDTIAVEVFAASTAVHAVSPYPFRNAQGTSVPITIFGAGLAGVTSAAQVSCSGVGTTIIGTPTVNGAGTQITGLSVAVASDAPKGARIITVMAPGGSGRATFYLYPKTPGPFALIAPGNGSTTATVAPRFDWTPSDSAALYFVQLATDAAFSNVVLTSPSTLNSTSWQAPFGVLSASTSYFVSVRSTNETGTFVFAPSQSFTTGTASGSNNACANAFQVFDGMTPISSVNATTDGPNEPSCESGGDSLLSNDVWYRYTATCGGILTVSLCGSLFDSMLAVYGNTCPVFPGSVIVCNDDACGVASSVTFNAVRNTTYRIRVGGWGGSTGYGTLTITCLSTCPGDANNDSIVNFGDVSGILTFWGFAYPGSTGPGDSNHDGAVDFADITSTLTNFGLPCP